MFHFLFALLDLTKAIGNVIDFCYFYIEIRSSLCPKRLRARRYRQRPKPIGSSGVGRLRKSDSGIYGHNASTKNWNITVYIRLPVTLVEDLEAWMRFDLYRKEHKSGRAKKCLCCHAANTQKSNVFIQSVLSAYMHPDFFVDGPWAFVL